MAGHNKWSKIKHRKAVVDKRRGKAWTKCAKAIIVAAKHGGADPSTNLALRYAIDEARYENMPNDTIDRAIKKGAGAGAGEDYEAVRYEGYGPGGVAIVVEALTNNRTRTAGDLRLSFGRHAGNLGATGCVGFMFESKGRIVVAGDNVDEDRLFEVAAGAGADDVAPGGGEEEGSWTILMPVPAFASVRSALEEAKLKIGEARLEMVPTTLAKLDVEQAKAIIELVDELEDNDDVQKVYTNADISDEVLAAMEESARP